MSDPAIDAIRERLAKNECRTYTVIHPEYFEYPDIIHPEHYRCHEDCRTLLAALDAANAEIERLSHRPLGHA